MKHRLYLLGMTLMLVVAFSLSASAQSFVIPVYASVDSTIPVAGKRLDTLAFGFVTGANYYLDTTDNYLNYREDEQPPFPPSGVFYIRFAHAISVLGDTLMKVDLRPAIPPGGNLDSFCVRFQTGDDGPPVHLAWGAGLNVHFTELRMVDAVTYGSMFNVDMLTSTTFDVPAPHTAFFIYCRPIIAPPAGSNFYSLTPMGVFDEDPLKIGKSKKPAKRFKGFYPNVGNLLSEVVAQGGFQPGTSESDSAGGMVVGIASMYEKDPIKHKWAPVKADAATRSWSRLTAWNFAKNVGKSYNAIQKPLKDKTGIHIGIPRGFDSTGVPGDLKRKLLVKQLKGIFPKKCSNLLFSELLALKVNIAASALGKTPAGFGELLYNDPGHPFHGWALTRIAEHVDSMMTFWAPYSPPLTTDLDAYRLADTAITRANRSFVQPLDTLSWEAGGKDVAQLVVKGNVSIAAAPYLQMPVVFVPTVITPANNLTEAEEDFEDFDPEEVEGVPVAMTLMQNFPNPFNPTTTLAFHLADDANVTITVYDMLGREVGKLADREELEAGVQTVEFDASGLASGVYFYRVSAENLETGAQIAPVIGKMMLLK